MAFIRSAYFVYQVSLTNTSFIMLMSLRMLKVVKIVLALMMLSPGILMTTL